MFLILPTKYLIFSFAFFLVWQNLTGDVAAASKCSRLLKTTGGEQLINSCNSCRIIKLQRKRPGTNAPINRTYTVPPNTTTNLSFRGPGNSRVLSDTSCYPVAFNNMGKKNNISPKRADKRCILMQRVEKAGIAGLALANTCKECRIAVVDRVDSRGSRRSQNVVIGGNSVVPLPSKGASQAGIMSEKSCN
jgi:hypothetical protein